MKIKWLIILTVALIILIIVSLFLGRGNNKILTSAAKEDNAAEQSVVFPVEAPALVAVPPSPAQPVKRAITMLKAPEQNEEAKTESIQDLVQSSAPEGSSNPSSVSGTAVPEVPKAGVTKVGKEAPPEVIRGIKSKGIIIL